MFALELLSRFWRLYRIKIEALNFSSSWTSLISVDLLDVPIPINIGITHFFREKTSNTFKVLKKNVNLDCLLGQAYKLDILKKTQEQKNSKLKEKTQ